MELREAQQAALIWLLVDLCMINCLKGSMIKKKKKKVKCRIGDGATMEGNEDKCN